MSPPVESLAFYKPCDLKAKKRKKKERREEKEKKREGIEVLYHREPPIVDSLISCSSISGRFHWFLFLFSFLYQWRVVWFLFPSFLFKAVPVSEGAYVCVGVYLLSFFLIGAFWCVWRRERVAPRAKDGSNDTRDRVERERKRGTSVVLVNSHRLFLILEAQPSEREAKEARRRSRKSQRLERERDERAKRINHSCPMWRETQWRWIPQLSPPMKRTRFVPYTYTHRQTERQTERRIGPIYTSTPNGYQPTASAPPPPPITNK